jgi:hypothetical protein
MANVVIWVKPYEAAHHTPGTEGHKGLCGWHGTTPWRRGPCTNEPYARGEAQVRGLRAGAVGMHRGPQGISQCYGLPIPQEHSERVVENS